MELLPGQKGVELIKMGGVESESSVTLPVLVQPKELVTVTV